MNGSFVPDFIIREWCKSKSFIAPFSERNSEGVLSYGIGPYGYDLRLGTEVYLIHNKSYSSTIDPKNFDKEKCLILLDKNEDKSVTIPQQSSVLVTTIEKIKMPEDCLGLVIIKSSYARCGIILEAGVIEPGWEGIPTFSLHNPNQKSVKIYPEEGFAQLLTFKNELICEKDYKKLKGKYQNTTVVTGPRVM